MNRNLVYELTEQKICPGSYSFTWDGTVNAGYYEYPPDEWSNIAPSGLYTFDVEVIANPYDRDAVRSQALTVVPGPVEYLGYDEGGTPDDEEDDNYLYFLRVYTLRSYRNSSRGEIWLYDPELDMVLRWEVSVLRCVEHEECEGLTASPSSERHGVIIPVPIKVMEKVGTYRFVLHFYDDYGDSYKDHEPKPALEVNATIKPIIVCIDPGHGGKDPGAVGPTGLTEKEANWEIALKIRERLQKEGYKVRMTRLEDDYRGLKERIEIAHGKRSEEGKLLNKPEPPADIFVSIHNNAVPPGSGREPLGAIVFYYKPIDYRLAQCLYDYLHKTNPGNIKDGLRKDDFLC